MLWYRPGHSNHLESYLLLCWLICVQKKLQEEHRASTKQGPRPRMELSCSNCFHPFCLPLPKNFSQPSLDIMLMHLLLITLKSNALKVRKHGSTSQPAPTDFLFDITHCPTGERESLMEGVKPWKTAGATTTGFKMQKFCGNQFCGADRLSPSWKVGSA